MSEWLQQIQSQTNRITVFCSSKSRFQTNIMTDKYNDRQLQSRYTSSYSY